MVFLDLIFAGFLVFGCISGLMDGFFSGLASLVSLFVGIYVAFKFSFLLQEVLATRVSWNPHTVQLTAFALTFILVVFGVLLLGKTLTAFAKFSALGWANRLAGGVLGLVRSVLMLGVALMIFEKANIGHTLVHKATLEKSFFYPKIVATTAWLYPSLREWIAETVKD